MSPPDVPRPFDVIVPFYRNAAVVVPLFRSLAEVQEELRDLDSIIVVVNDSPEDADLEKALTEAVDELSPIVPCRLIRNERNLGFVRSVNVAARQSINARHDVLLLNSDTIVFPGALREMRKVALCDPLIGFVSPRTNNASFCSFPPQKEFWHLDPAEAFASFRELCGYLPEFHLAPTAVGFCLFIKREVLVEFGLFDEIYGQGYNEENDLIMRANRCGYRAAIANHAFVYHIGEASFSASSTPRDSQEEKNVAILKERYPEYWPSITSYFSGIHYQAEHLISGLLPDREGRLDLIFDFTSLGAYHSGTMEAAKAILFQATRIWRQFNLYVMASDHAVRFHRLDELQRVSFVSPATERKFAVAFRPCQPFGYEHLFRMSRVAALNVYAMLDPIAYDCLYLNDVDLETMWGAVFAHADGVIYISDFVQEAFRRRFRMRPGLHELVAYLSLDYRDYANESEIDSQDGSYILVVGNHFAHKRVPATVEALSSAFPREKIVVLGLAEDHRHNVTSYQSGQLSENRMDQLYRGARFVVFPSTYEGFGFPVVKSLAYRKPVVARSIPTNRAIKEKLGEDENLILYSSTEELVIRLGQSFPIWKNGAETYGDAGGGWDATTDRIGQFLCSLTRSISFSDVLVPRLQYMRLLKENQRVHRHALSAQQKPDAELEAARAAYEELRATVRARDSQIAELRAAVHDRDAQIRDICHSRSWRLSAPMRNFARAYRSFKGNV
jgi:GT2 family glycosyltransferase